jgi:hypothetical protein
MEKLDLKKQLKHLYAPSAKEVTLVDVPEMQFVMLDGELAAGEGPDESEDFQNAFGALYGISYTLKFMSKQREKDPIDYTVMAMEGLWSVPSGQFDFNRVEPWVWTLLMMQPDHITDEMYEEALEKLRAKRDNPAVDRLRFERWCEGPSVQIMHLGP